MPERVRVLAPAKINLYLRIDGKRPDGFHDLETLFQAVDLTDELILERAGAGVDLQVEGADLGPPEENLVFRAAEAFLEAAGRSEGLRIRLTKRIPAGAGLGGGSSDAGATLRALDGLMGPLAPRQLHGIAAALGSDVPFFAGPSPLALGEGRGERLTSLHPLPGRDLLLALPPVHVATAQAYGELATARASDDRPSDPAPRIPLVVAWRSIAARARNDFEEVVAADHPEVAATLDALRDVDPEVAMLSGSGAACFAILPPGRDCAGLASALTERLGWPVLATRTLPRWPAPDGSSARA